MGRRHAGLEAFVDNLAFPENVGEKAVEYTSKRFASARDHPQFAGLPRTVDEAVEHANATPGQGYPADEVRRRIGTDYGPEPVKVMWLLAAAR